MQPDLQAALLYCRNLPSPPGIALRIIELAQDPDVDMATAADVIGMDMALSARMLRVANSPLYASRRRVDNLGQALTMLGLNATLSLALGFSMVHGLRSTFAPQHERVWRRAGLCALASRVLGQAYGIRKPEELMLAGLLQDIGTLALLQGAPDTYAQLFEHATDNTALLDAERQHLGTTHADVGAWLAHQWQLPPYLQNAIAQSEEDPASLEPFMACVALSGRLADIWLSASAAAATECAQRQAQDVLHLDAERFEKVIERIAESLPELEALFDIRVPQPEHVQMIFEQARELAMLRNLRELQEVAEARRHADESENRMRHLAEQASRDALTGVFNRHQLGTALAHEFDLASRQGWPLSIAFIDLDNFKRINDAHGHLVGDKVLRNFAQTLQRMVRASDLVARYGGEEFLVILPNTPAEAALMVVERILAETARTPMAQLQGGPLHITFSAGLATHGGVERQFDSIDHLLQAADSTLYRSKHRGRNRVSTYDATEVPTPPGPRAH
ncbi:MULTISPECIES: sensor domain-containing diguanylate cyclase [Xanthomonas]|uniref:diguanylate cyclase n=1 Tax=Xanthomonas cucurbitae TaxID=56453 RepID=A0A2S7DR35_9XANT|nr:GGDEF domain-containing protein [Xanthomonas cucurbitae]PPU76283.1 GGDEF domain-containing protein [Xanthomonas cucurbitae]QHG86608.1 GGDEF domain-containing protein [Xanthomonas cucurbitae]WDM68864.1 GGDEF domain-containing protein [Xanthomonas cucurbitae]WDM72737.1 GGDEF domain-containing protein [Xanthomonas cucurbitae]WDM76523.1 GGDEF domain-containing protein [Xanthomonas cucurbitae]